MSVPDELRRYVPRTDLYDSAELISYHMPIEQPPATASYIIFKKGNKTYAKNGVYGHIEYENTDPTEVIQYAIDKTYSKGGGTILLTAGTYEVSTIKLRDKVRITGEGIRATKVKLKDGENANVFEWAPTSNEYFAGLFDMIVDGNKDNNTSGHCLYTTDANGGDPRDFHSARVWYDNAAQDGVHLDSSWGYKFTDCLFEGNGQDGLYNAGSQLCVTSFYAALNGRHGIYHEGVDSVFSGKIHGNNGHGLYITGHKNHGSVCITDSGYNGAFIHGDKNVFQIYATNSSLASSGTYYNLRVYGSENNIRGVALGGSHIKADVWAGGVHNWLWLRFDSIEYSTWGNEKYLQIINGVAINEGDPDSTGAWATLTKEDGLIIRDTTNNITYVYDSRVAGGRYTV